MANCLFNVIHDKFESLLCSGEKHPKRETWRRCRKRWWRGQNSAGVNNSFKFSNIGQPSTILVTLGITTFVHDSVEGQIWSLVKGSLSPKIAPKAIWAGCSCIQPSEEEPQDWPADRTQVGHCHGVCLHVNSWQGMEARIEGQMRRSRIIWPQMFWLFHLLEFSSIFLTFCGTAEKFSPARLLQLLLFFWNTQWSLRP